jgi:hypothetical protein
VTWVDDVVFILICLAFLALIIHGLKSWAAGHSDQDDRGDDDA